MKKLLLLIVVSIFSLNVYAHGGSSAIRGVRWTPVNIVAFPIALFDPEETEAAFRSYYDGTAWFSENQDWNVSENNFIAVGVFIDSKDINIIKEPLYYIVLKNEDTWEIVSIWNN